MRPHRSSSALQAADLGGVGAPAGLALAGGDDEPVLVGGPLPLEGVPVGGAVATLRAEVEDLRHRLRGLEQKFERLRGGDPEG